MKHKLLPLLFASLLSLSTASAQTNSAAYEVTGNMPVFYQQMKQQLTYPLAWGKAEEKDFAKWKAQARHVLAECMQNLQPAPKAYAMEVTDREQRDGYEARKIRFNQACKLLKEGRYNVAEISTMVGFNTPSYFATSFKKYIGCMPSEYAKNGMPQQN